MDRARRSIAWSLVAPGLWLVMMGAFALGAPNLPPDFRAHVEVGLGLFASLVLGPLLLLLAFPNWILKRVAAFLVTLLYLGTARGALVQGFGWVSNAIILTVCIAIVGSVLFFLSSPAVRDATQDGFRFLDPRDIFSRYAIRRKPR